MDPPPEITNLKLAFHTVERALLSLPPVYQWVGAAPHPKRPIFAGADLGNTYVVVQNTDLAALEKIQDRMAKVKPLHGSAEEMQKQGAHATGLVGIGG